ncbi:hypothetical protein [Acidihalobacter ferrooxydans]|uniref:Uncharacterized protein n=1 Tax=Acidihalobacter ferrooxydans TaxID=1765967 RepID=A0A1P8UD72_9GAMM|nr:hypothetical protein [Acidihalobacter ferrooxydans]APZ41768.1 hypothetical protein BW247_00545 [Acidihalobacter ferrooxydans]
MKYAKALYIAPLFALLSLPAMAGQRDHNGKHFLQRIDRQEHRIHQGVRTGDLTHREARRLNRNHHRITGKFRQFKRDRRLVAWERRRLENMLDRNSRLIARFRHNDQRRYTQHWQGPFVIHGGQQQEVWRVILNRYAYR